MIILSSTIINLKTLFLLVKTTSDATLDSKATIVLTQEQPEERIGSEKDPQRFCLTITIRSSNNCRMIGFIVSACVLEFKFKDMSLSVVKMCVFNVSITHCITTRCVLQN